MNHFEREPPKPPSDRWEGCGCPADLGECQHIKSSRSMATGLAMAVPAFVVGVVVLILLAAGSR